jgi:hypothetical protein
VIDSLAWLRNGWDGDNSEQAITAFQTLDNAGVFQQVDEQTGYDVDGGRPAGRQSAAQSREGTTGAGGLDAGDRAAMGRLARRAFPNDTGRNASYPEDPPRRPDPRDVSSGNGTEFS